MLTPISGAYGSEPSLVRGDVSLREEGVNANRKPLKNKKFNLFFINLQK